MAEKLWTKDAEREQLRKIAELIDETEPGSYIRMAFAGCVRMAEENIEYDFANSYPELLEYKDKQIVELEQAKCDAREYRASTEKVLDDMTEELTMWKNKHTDSVEHYEKIIAENNGKIAELRRDIAGCEDCNKELREQIIRLKAEIYDWERA